MKLATLSYESRLRKAAALLMSLPTIVAAACFAHGHGVLGSYGLLAALATCVAAGALGSYGLLSLIRKPARLASRLAVGAPSSVS
ncbi:MAG: hypothetical protein ACREUE_10515 [Panacagrimonas sp.]